MAKRRGPEAARDCASSRQVLTGGLIATVVLTILAAYLAMLSLSTTPKRPHIVFIMADDLGWGDVSYHGSHQIRTPNIDALAWNGVRLDRLYSQPMCSPSRAALMTGLYPIHTGLQHYVILANEPRGLALNFKILPQWLSDLGYTSHIVGKWHLGLHKTEYTPTKRGFASHLGSWTGMCDYYAHNRKVEGSAYGHDFRRNLSLDHSNDGRYYTHVVTEEAVSLIENHPIDKPLFLLVSHLAPHIGTPREPVQAPDEYVGAYESIAHENRTIFAGMMSALDESVGTIFRTLHERGILEESVVVFSSDNGAATTPYGVHGGSSWPLKGEKETLWEGGVRVPALIWTSKPLGRGRGSIYNNYFHFTDWLPTLYEMAGGNPSDLGDIDGVSHAGSLNDAVGVSRGPRNEMLLNIDPVDNHSAIIDDRYKLVKGTVIGGAGDKWFPIPGNVDSASDEQRAADACRNSTVIQVLGKLPGFTSPACGDQSLNGSAYSKPIDCGPGPADRKSPCQSTVAACLFDIESDPCEQNDQAAEEPEVAERLLSKLRHWESTAVEPNNAPPDVEGNPDYHGGAWVPWKDGTAT